MVLGSRKRLSDDFVISEDENSQPKKTKTSATKKSKTPNASKSSSKSNSMVDANGDRYWEISKMRRVTVSSFRGKTMVSIREYYEKDGQELPGKKGISMPIEQFANFLSLLPDIETALKESGVSVPRPDYSDATGQSVGDDNERQESSDDKHEGSVPSKKNIEATSEEDESEA